MKFSLPLLAALLGVAAAAPYTPPADNPDGAYYVEFDKSGEAITKRLDDSIEQRAPEPLSSGDLVTRADNFPGNPGASCGGRVIPGPQDNSYSVVQNCLGTWLAQNSGKPTGGSGRGGGVFYCRNKDTLLAVCLYDQDSIAGSAAEIDTFNSIMDRQCGAWKAGYVFIKNWNKTYWRTTWGEEVCGNLNTGVRRQVFA